MKMDRILYYLILFFLNIVSVLPLRVHYFLSRINAFLLLHVFRYRTTEVVMNMSRSFPEMKYAEIRKLVKEYYRHMADIISETVWAYTASTKRISRMLELRNVGILNEVYGTGRNVVVMLGHQGNWELYTGMSDLRTTYGMNLDNKDFVFVYKKMASSLANDVICRMRSKHKSCTLVESGSIVRHMLKDRESHSVCYFIADQSPFRGNGPVVDFLHQPTKMINGPEYVARKLGLPVLFFSIDKVARGRYVGTYIKVCDNAAETEEGFVTRRFAELLQESIGNNRSSWLWSHKRWKARLKMDNK